MSENRYTEADYQDAIDFGGRQETRRRAAEARIKELEAKLRATHQVADGCLFYGCKLALVPSKGEEVPEGAISRLKDYWAECIHEGVDSPWSPAKWRRLQAKIDKALEALNG